MDPYTSSNSLSYGIGSAITTTACAPLTLQQRLDYAVKTAQERLAEATEARDIFKRNPDLERLLNIMQKGNF